MCSITLSVMRDPVTASDGCTYERSAIAEWLTRRRSSPLTNCAIISASLAPDDALRRSIDQWARGVVDCSLTLVLPAAGALQWQCSQHRLAASVQPQLAAEQGLRLTFSRR